MSGSDEVPIFGSRVEGCPYVVTPSAYAIVRRGVELAVVETDRGRFLPGGGLETGESPIAAIEREALEECGLSLRVDSHSTEAIEIVHSPAEGTCFEKRSTFATATIRDLTIEREQEHRLLWVSVEEALRTLSNESHRWAVERLVGDSTRPAPTPAELVPGPQKGPGMFRSQMRLVPHDPSWLAWFADEASRIRGVLPGRAVRVEHVGSTAIPGMLAKPIIDIAVIAKDMEELVCCIGPLTELGYEYRGQHSDDPLHRYLVLDRGGRRIAQLHLCAEEAESWRVALAYRDLLRRRADLRAAYGEEKLRFAEAVRWNKAEYSIHKGPFIEALIQTENLRGEALDP